MVATATPIPVAPAVPVLCSVRVCAGLVVAGLLTPTLPKLNGPPVTLKIAVGPPRQVMADPLVVAAYLGSVVPTAEELA